MVKRVNPHDAIDAHYGHQSRFSFANDPVATPKMPQVRKRGIFGRVLMACGAFCVFAAAGGIAALSMPGHQHFEARILAVIPQGENVADTNMDAVLKYASGFFSSQDMRQASERRFGSDRTGAIILRQEKDAPVLAISSTVEDEFLARETIDYFADSLTKEVKRDPGAEDARHILNQTLEQASAELAAFEGDAAPAESAFSGADIARLKARADAAAEYAASASKLSLQSVLSGQVPETVMTQTLISLVEQYAKAKADLEALADKLGPRHPQYLAAKAIAAAAQQKIGNEIRRTVKTARTETQAAAAALLKAEKEGSDTTARQGDHNARLLELQDAVTAAKANIEAFDSSLAPLPPARFRLISPAMLVDEHSSQSDLLVLGGLAAGLIAAILTLSMPRRREKSEGFVRDRAVEPAMHRAAPSAAEGRSMLDQLNALEAAWPPTGREEPMPYHANDEAAQDIDPAVLALATRIAALRKRAQDASKSGHEASLEEAIAEMRRLRSKVRHMADARQNRA